MLLIQQRWGVVGLGVVLGYEACGGRRTTMHTSVKHTSNCEVSNLEETSTCLDHSRHDPNHNCQGCNI
eukprot:5483759-Amphidinium_carterae.1